MEHLDAITEMLSKGSLDLPPHARHLAAISESIVDLLYPENGMVIREEKRHPTIEDRVVIYANATILGGKTVIGHDSVISANVWLMESVNPGSHVGIEPPVVRRKEQPR